MRRLMVPAILLLAACALVLLALPSQADPLEYQERSYALERRARDDAATENTRRLAGDLWNLLPPLLLLAVAGTGLATIYQDRATRRRRLEPDANGFYPLPDPERFSREIAAHLTAMLYAGQGQALIQRYTAPALVTPPARELPALPPPALLAHAEPRAVELPTAPSWSEIVAQGWRPTAERMLLGYTAGGPLYGGIAALLSTAIAGRPGQGKTTALRFVYAQTVRSGGQVVILDPHGAIADALGERQALWTASSPAELADGAGWLQEELERRDEAYKRRQRVFAPLLVLCDEWPVIGLQSKAAVDACSRVILEARKWGMYALISGQGLPADRFGGSLVRDALSSRYIFRTTPAQARMAGLDKEAARLVEELDVGRAILDGPTPAPTIVAIPNTTALDLDSLARTGAATAGEQAVAQAAAGASAGQQQADGARQQAGGEAEPVGRVQPGGGLPQAAPPLDARGFQSPEEARVVSLFRGGADVAQIVRELYDIDSKQGRRYQEASAGVQLMLRRALGGAV